MTNVASPKKDVRDLRACAVETEAADADGLPYALLAAVRGREHELDDIPSIPAIIQDLLNELNRPLEEVEMARVAELIGRDKALTAHCLRVANSPLLGQRKAVSTVRDSVRVLGLRRTADITMSCGVMRIGNSQRVLDPVVLWEHSFGCAMLSRKLARSIAFENPDEAYLAGLLHDVGYVVNFVMFPQQMRSILEEGALNGTFAGEIEISKLGFTHSHSGTLLANRWKFAPEIVEVIRHHHHPARASIKPALTAIVALSDKLCRSLNLGLGYVEGHDPAMESEADWAILSRSCAGTKYLTWPEFVKDAEAYATEIRELANTMYSTRPD